LAPAPPPAPVATPAMPADVGAWVLGGPSLEARLLPLAAAYPAVLDDGPRALRWADLLLEEDPTSPYVLELVATIFGRDGRFGGTARMLMELAFHTPDRPAGLARGAVVWERLGRPREACAQWIRAARWRDEPADPLWLRAPGAGKRSAPTSWRARAPSSAPRWPLRSTGSSQRARRTPAPTRSRPAGATSGGALRRRSAWRAARRTAPRRLGSQPGWSSRPGRA